MHNLLYLFKKVSIQFKGTLDIPYLLKQGEQPGEYKNVALY